VISDAHEGIKAAGFVDLGVTTRNDRTRGGQRAVRPYQKKL
jgi:hypothetical protein